MVDFLPSNDEAAAAHEMIEGLDEKFRNEAAKLIGQAKKMFESLSPDEQQQRRERAAQQIKDAT